MERQLGVDDDILEFFSEVLDIKIARGDLEAPTQGLVTTVMMAIFRDFALSDAAMSVLDASVPWTNNVDHIQTTLPLIHLVKLMQIVYSCMGVNDIGLSDIVQPKPKRTKRLFKLLCQEWKPLCGVWEQYNTIHEQYLQAKADSKGKQNRLDDIKAKINQLSRHPGINPERREAVERELAATQGTIEAMDERRISVASEYQVLKTQLCELRERQTQHAASLTELNAAIQETRSKICQSPDRLKRRVAEERDRLVLLNNEYLETQRQVNDQRQKVQLLPKIEAACGEFENLLDNRYAEHDKIEELRQEKDKLERNRRTLDAEHHHLLKELDREKEEGNQLKVSLSTTHQTLSSSLDHSRKKVMAMEQHLTEITAKRKQVVRLQDSVATKLQTSIQETTAKIQIISQASSELVAKTNAEIERILADDRAMALRFEALMQGD